MGRQVRDGRPRCVYGYQALDFYKETVAVVHEVEVATPPGANSR